MVADTSLNQSVELGWKLVSIGCLKFGFSALLLWSFMATLTMSWLEKQSIINFEIQFFLLQTGFDNGFISLYYEVYSYDYILSLSGTRLL